LKPRSREDGQAGIVGQGVGDPAVAGGSEMLDLETTDVRAGWPRRKDRDGLP
jgi:hypothetical protein